MAFGHQRADDAQGHALDQNDRAERVVGGRKELMEHGLAENRHERGAVLVFDADGAAGSNLPIGDRRIVGGDPLHHGRPVLAGVFDLAALADQIGDLSDGLVLVLNRPGIADGQGRGAAGAAPSAQARHRAGNDDEQVGAEAFKLLAHGVVGALPDRHHRNQRGDADEDAEHGQRRPHLVARQRLHGGGQDHHTEGPGQRRAAPHLRGGMRVKDRQIRRRRGRCPGKAGGLALVGEDAAIAHRHRASGISGDIGLVRHQDDGDALLAIELRQRLHDLVRGTRIEIAGGLVGKEQARRIDQRPRDRDPLLLAAGKLTGRVFRAIAEAEAVQRLLRAGETRLAPGLSLFRIEQRQGHVFQRARARQQVEALEDKSEPLAADASELGLRQARDIDAVEQIAAGRWTVEAAEDRHQSRLAGARRPHDGHELAALDGEIDAAEGANIDVADVICARHAFNRDDRVGHGAPASR